MVGGRREGTVRVRRDIREGGNFGSGGGGWGRGRRGGGWDGIEEKRRGS